MWIVQITQDDKTEEIFVKRKNLKQNLVRTFLLWIQGQKLPVLKFSPVYFTIGKNFKQALSFTPIKYFSSPPTVNTWN